MTRLVFPLLLLPLLAACEPEAERSVDATPVAPSADPSAETPSVTTPTATPEQPDLDLGHAVVIDFDPEQTGIYLGVELEGPSGRVERLEYLFDTGASYTTITSETARKLGIEIPADAPRLEFDTAAGKRSDAMVRLPALKIGDVRVPSLAVSICDACATRRGVGLLGLNVIREFVVQTDYQTSQMRLLPRVQETRPNRAFDIQPLLDLDIEGTAEVVDGKVEWTVAVKNKSVAAIEDVVPRVSFGNGVHLTGAAITRIEPGASGRSTIAGNVLDKGEEGGALSYTLSLVEARW